MNELTVKQEVSDQEFKALVNGASQMKQVLNFPELIKFDAVDGEFLISDGKDDKEKTIFNKIGKDIEVHIVSQRHSVQVKEGDEIVGWSREVDGNFFEINFKDRDSVSGLYKNLKQKYGDSIIYNVVLYAYYADKLVRIKLSGGKLSKWFDYSKTFVNDAVACWTTKMSCGQFIEKTKMVKYYEVNIERGEEIKDRSVIVNNINECRRYLEAYSATLNKTEEVQVEEIPPQDNYQQAVEAEVENINF